MLRDEFTERMKTALRAKDTRTLSTVRLIMAALKDRDIAARSEGNKPQIPDADIQRMLQGMIKQRRESMALYQKGNRPELARQEGEEIAVIESFLPQQLDDAAIEAAAKLAIVDSGAAGIKDMGKVMGALRERHAGVLDMAKAGAAVRRLLG
ncbi:MAG TPA: GatB/YqeY domain-containing protein [Stellaceae bacterium]|nr:GatB/YqeY domain-containing protein [Stellaceae bacterium]